MENHTGASRVIDPMSGGISLFQNKDVYWLALSRVPKLGKARLRKLLSRIPDPRSIFSASSECLEGFGLGKEAREYIHAPDWSIIEKDLAWLEPSDRSLLPWDANDYPSHLLEIPDPPPFLFTRGNREVLTRPQIAIVGSRNPTPTGQETAFAFARELARMGFVITSGLATGIDGAAHRGAMAGGGQTIAVVGTGLDRVYPARHRELGLEIVQHGVCVSEFPLGMPPLAAHFPRRNRIISGLSLGVLVVEATTHSGSLITARLAVEQGREVFTIPGSIHNPLSRGCHMLLRQGAKLVESAADILEEIGPQDITPSLARGMAEAETMREATPIPAEQGFSLDAEYKLLLDNLGFEPTTIDILVERTGFMVEALSSMLLTLELDGHVASAPGGRYLRTGQSKT
uniref:DNA protecting protein DprA n=1 Tax=Candidatus Kentrum sp. MB TaxID=2138164 RepID=A0A450XV92_9GAMM|nr:MAG: DNA protecting protein DprA [Candidatus Kentron sp. MB]VFK33234.1 MAG: DNA protecting protein DprA [Candidatus Kentron sp. MB]VFK76105.1 MAG: DNA protecting protein DprA [Candidatus Kentron sp. MB]